MSRPTAPQFDLLPTDNKSKKLKLDDEGDMLQTAVKLVVVKVSHCDTLGDFSTVRNDDC